MDLTKEEKKQEIKKYRDNITAKLQDIKAAKLPIVVIIEGWAASCKGELLNELIKNIDPRFYTVFVDEQVKDRDDYPFIYPYFCALPEDGKFRFYSGSYLRTTVNDCLAGKLSEKSYQNRVKAINNFERTIINNGYVVVKIFLNVSKEEQTKRLNKLKDSKSEAWRVKKFDLEQNKNHDQWMKATHAFIDDTSMYAPWHVINADSRTNLKYESFRLLSFTIDRALERGKVCAPAYEESFEMEATPLLKDIDLSPKLEREEYEEKLDKLSEEIMQLDRQLYRKGIPVIIAFEGWDAAGKGGAIRRLAYPFDPRGMEVMPIASPDKYELARHYLWRFYRRLPKRGFVHFFDRTWYGRVMVERLEGFCSENDWKRAYNEMNEFEEQLVNEGAVILKFWMQIDKDTQLERFTERQNTPEKQWKITDEDWRNRDKWDLYEVAIDEMIQKTSTKFAPWHIIESVDKLYARIRVLEITRDALLKALEEK